MTYRLNALKALSLIMSSIVLIQGAQGRTKAFPSAEGFGRNAQGGRNGAIYFVNTLTDESVGSAVQGKAGVYEGSLRFACEASGARTVIFRVGGTIVVGTDPIRIRHPFITIAGETAPGQGILLRKKGVGGHLLSCNTHDIIIRHLRFRKGPGSGADCFEPTGGTEDLIIDHCSFSWGTDENLSFSGNRKHHASAKNITVQWCYITEPLHRSTQNRPHARATMAGQGADRVTYFANLMANADYRMPKVGTIKGHLADPKGAESSMTCEVVNNVVYHWKTAATSFGRWPGGNEDNPNADVFINIINNYYKAGPETPTEGIREISTFARGGRTIKAFVQGNIGPHRPNDIDQSLAGQWALVGTWGHPWPAASAARHQASAPFATPTVHTSMDAFTAYAEIPWRAGATKPRRDEVDQRIYREVTSGSALLGTAGKIIDAVTPEDRVCCGADGSRNAGGWPDMNHPDNNRPYVDIDKDGIADTWESNIEGSTASFDANGDHDGDGFTNLEEFLHYMAGDN